MENQQIILSAFRIWQNRMFAQTSLTPLAEELGVTKSAIYRHFPGKAALKREMESYFADSYAEASRGFRLKSAGENLTSALTDYAEDLFSFLSATPGFTVYMTTLLFHRHDREKTAFWPVLTTEAGQIYRLFQTQGLSAQQSEAAVRYLYTHLFGWALFLLRNEKAEKEIRDSAGEMIKAFLEGFVPDSATVDYAHIEDEVVVHPDDLPGENRIIRSLLKVVSKEGLHRATVSRIAEEAGYSKSTLYSFFKNKKDMLFRVFTNHAAAADTLYHRISGDENPVEEQVYRLIVLLYRYLKQNRAFLVTLNWMRFQNLHLGPDEALRWKEKMPRFVLLMDNAQCRNYGLEPSNLIGLLWLQLIREIMEICRPENLVEDGTHEDIEHLRSLHRLYCRGLKGAIEE